MKYRSIFISDIHLGTRDSQTTELLEFIRDIECQKLFLVGDIIDGWALRRRWVWTQGHSDVIQKLLRKARKGTEVTYILGNHDEFMRSFLPLTMGDRINVLNECEYISKGGKRYLVTHGDLFDSITMTKRWLAIAGDIGYQMLLRINRPVNFIRNRIGYKNRWSLSQYVKENVKQSVMFITDFENILSLEARNRGFDGVICGHIHKPEKRMIGDMEYLNCGDWVESCSAIVEREDGEFEVLDWHSFKNREER